MTDADGMVLHLGVVRYDLARGAVWTRAGDPVPMPAQARALLRVLARERDAVATQDLIAEVWGKAGATEETLIASIADLRKALGDDASHVVQTVPMVGYRLVPTPPPKRMERRDAYRIAGLAVAGLPVVYIVVMVLIGALGG